MAQSGGLSNGAPDPVACTSAPRRLAPDDVPAAMRLKEAANWNQTAEDWRRLMQLSPDGCFGIDCGGALAATATAVCFERKLAWIGMVLTDPAHRGRGFARRLMCHAIAWIEARGVDWIKLDATEMGRPLYASLGFADECAIKRWIRPPLPAGARGVVLPPADLDRCAALDGEAFGSDRRPLLDLLSGIASAGLSGHGYAMGRPGSNAAYFGPCVARSSAEARQLLGWWLAPRAAETIFWDILPSNFEAVALAHEFGFAPLRRLVRMVRPGRQDAHPFFHNDSYVFAIAGFEFG